MYIWGWNSNGELGIDTKEKRVCALPALINFKNHRGEDVEINVKKVECGNSFTVCSAGNMSIDTSFLHEFYFPEKREIIYLLCVFL